MIVGTLAGAGTLGLLIPPSITMIIYGVTVNESITRLFIASLIPGLTLALMFMLYVAGWGFYRRREQPRALAAALPKWRAFLLLVPALTLIGLVIASIYSGIATATEAAALGVCGALGLSRWQGTLTRATFARAFTGCGQNQRDDYVYTDGGGVFYRWRWGLPAFRAISPPLSARWIYRRWR